MEAECVLSQQIARSTRNKIIGKRDTIYSHLIFRSNGSTGHQDSYIDVDVLMVVYSKDCSNCMLKESLRITKLIFSPRGIKKLKPAKISFLEN